MKLAILALVGFISVSSFVLQLKNEKQAIITIENMLGQVVYKSEIKNQKSEINISTFVPGVYFVKVKNGNTINSTKLIIQK